MIKKIIAGISRTEKTVESIAEGFFSTITKLEQHADTQLAAAVKYSAAANSAVAKREPFF